MRNGNEQWCRKGEGVCEAAGQVGAGSALLGFLLVYNIISGIV